MMLTIIVIVVVIIIVAVVFVLIIVIHIVTRCVTRTGRSSARFAPLFRAPIRQAPTGTAGRAIAPTCSKYPSKYFS